MNDRQDKVILDFGAQRVTVTEDRFTIGRGDECDLTIDDDAQVSGVHVEVLRNDEGGFDVRDAGSTNGIFVNEQKVGRDAVTLRSGDTVRFGQTTFTAVVPDAPTRLGGGGETRVARSSPITLSGTDGVGRGTQINLSASPITIGRDESCDITIDDDELSRTHARVQAGADVVEVEDLDSRNGVFVAGRKISGSATAQIGEEIKLGRTTFSVTRAGATKVAGGTPVPAGSPGSGTPEKKEKTSLPLAAIIGGAALLLIIVAGGLALAGVFSSDDDPADEVPTTQELIAEARPSTVLVKALVGKDDAGGGTGWVYDAEQGLIVTNAHVIDAGDHFQVGVDGDPDLRSAEVVASAPCDDLAVLRVKSTAGLRTMPLLGSQSELEQGDPVITLGYPGNLTSEDELQVTQGTVSSVEASFDQPAQIDPDFQVYPNTVQLDAAINPGNSGGPSIDEQGQLIGVNTVVSGGENQSFAIGIDRVKEVVPTLAEGDSLGWAGFGFRAASNEEVAEVGQGFLEVMTVVPGTGAAENEVFVGDLITDLNGQGVETRQDYCNAVENVSKGEPILIEGFYSEGPYKIRVPFE